MNKRFTTLLGSLVFVLSTLVALTGLNDTAHAVVDNSPDCNDGVAVINCGVYSIAAAREKYGQGDIGKIYSAFGISHSDLSGDFQEGVVWRNGNVTVGDKVVGTDAITAGRNFGGTPIAGTNAGKYPTSKFATEGQTAFVKMVDGKFAFAIIKSCGNPVTANPPKQPPQPEFKCINLKVEELGRTKRKFTAEATASNGATIEKYEFGFGDGFGITIQQQSYTYDYKKTGSFKASVVVHMRVNGEIKKVNGPQCTAPVTIKEEPASPVFACQSLSAHLIDKDTRTYGFTLRYTAEGGATLRSVDFAFGDGAHQDDVAPAQLASVQHSFPREGHYTTVATLHFNVPGTDGSQVRDKKCQAVIDVSPEACPLNPSLPKNSPDCQPCPLPGKENLPKDSPECKETVLPAAITVTGPTDLIIGGLGLGSITAAGYYWRASRQRLVTTLLGQ